MTLDLAQENPRPVEIVAEDEAVLTRAALLGRHLLTTYLVDAKTEVRRLAMDGTPDGIVELPAVGSAGGFQDNEEDNEAFFIFSSFDTPTTVFRHDVAAILATTADTVDRGHTFNYVAALQAADLGSTPKLVRVETRAGHGAGMSLDKVIALHADMWVFAAHWTGPEVDQAEGDEIELSEVEPHSLEPSLGHLDGTRRR